MKRALGAVTAIALAAAAAVTVTTKAGLSVSNRLTPGRDARVIATTLTPKANWVPPFSWRVTVNDTLRGSVTSSLLSAVDTVWQPYPVCATYRITVRPFTPAKDSLTKKLSLCRPAVAMDSVRRAADSVRYFTAEVDSFPLPDRVARLCDGAPTPKPIAMADSVAYALFGRNRYTGVTVVLAGDTARCETTRILLQRLRPPL